ncbi:MAG: NADH-quinone oxidoreductase subunit C, partial [Muribaculaceae bacterium]|nr:NADH-quinone oxidoreductase subunit C [Muribaculaceae bacterium]
MSDLKQEILKIYPAAVFEEGECLQLNVAEKDWFAVAGSLKNKLGFDVLSALVGMDWGENLGVMYYLTSTSRQWTV